MSIARAEQLKKDLTDRFVVVADGVAELRRFEGLTGTVKTVNMNGRALVQFDNPVDISWYDIDPSYLQVVDAPVKKEKPAAHAAPAKAAPAAKPAGQSPLDAIRAKGAGGAAPVAVGGKKPSPLDLIRAGGAKKDVAAPSPTTSAPAESEPAASQPEPVAETAPAPAAPPAAAAPATAAAKPKSTADILAAIRKKS